MPDRVVLVDTSVLVDHLRGHEPATAALSGLLESPAEVVASVVTRAGIRHGLPERQTVAWAVLAGLLRWLPVTAEVADRAGDLAARYRRSHGAIDLVDFIIAGTTDLVGAELWTRNVRHFPMMPGLASPY